MQNKKRWFIIFGAIIIIVIIIMIFANIKGKNTVEMLKFQNTVYVVTNEPAKKADVLHLIGQIKVRIDNNQIPSNNFEANSLKKGTEIYAAKNGDEFPKTIFYKVNNKFYIATEAVNNKN